ncbi:MAG: formylglycine-generating enzyme family protein [Balneolaceae bacterium]
MMLLNKLHRVTTGILVMALALLFGWVDSVSAQAERVWIPDGSYHSLFPETEGEPLQVHGFYLDETPVTNSQFLEFVQNHPEWQKERVPRLFAGNEYLRHWESGLEPGNETLSEENRPVTRVSWFAASSYCEASGGRLPTMAEWEYAAISLDLESVQEWETLGYELIGWYSSVDAGDLREVGSDDRISRFGVRDLHGLVMEWVEDFRPPIADDISFDCGTAGRLQSDETSFSYARVIRTLTRMSYTPQTSIGILGFRCAYDGDRAKAGDQLKDLSER